MAGWPGRSMPRRPRSPLPRRQPARCSARSRGKKIGSPAFLPDNRHLAIDPEDAAAAVVDVATGRTVLRITRAHRRRLAGDHARGALRRLGRGAAEDHVSGWQRAERGARRPFLPGLPARAVQPGDGRRAARPEVRIGRSLPPALMILSPQSGDVASSKSRSTFKPPTRGAISRAWQSTTTAHGCSPGRIAARRQAPPPHFPHPAHRR